jgi:hypothetical protein
MLTGRQARARRARLAAAGAALLAAATSARAVHLNAPRAALDPAANVSALYAFRSWADPAKVVLILNTLPGQEPGDGPTYVRFDDGVRYRIHVDNNADGVASDVVYEVRFVTEQRPALGQYSFVEAYVGHPNIPIPELQGITALTGPQSAGITIRQTYVVSELRHGVPRELFQGQTLVAAPENVGAPTMPEYESLAAEAIHTDPGTSIRAFAGPRAETLYADVGALFDSASPRRIPPLLTPEEDADGGSNPFGVNRYAGTNVSSIVLEVPIERLTRDRRPAETTTTPWLGVFASTSRRRAEPRGRAPESEHSDHGFVQVARMGNALVNTFFVDTPDKDAFNAGRPSEDGAFQRFLRDPSLTRPPSSYIFGVPTPPPPRTELMALYLKYPGQPLAGSDCGQPCADLLRLDVRVPPTAPEQQHRLGALLGGDPAGTPNGRRPNDDVADITVRLIGGPVLIGARLGDGVNHANGVPGAGTSDGPGYGQIPGNRLDVTPSGIAKEFPFLPTPHSGRDHAHDH